MRILLVHNFYREPGGEDVVFRSEAELLRGHGHEVIEYTDDNREIRGRVPVLAAAEAVWSRRSRQRLSDLLRARPFDVAHFHNTFLRISPSAYYACRDAGVPVVQTLHNYRLLCPAANLYRDGRPCEDCVGRRLPWPSVLHGCYRGSRAETACVATVLAVHRLLETWRDRVHAYVALSEFARRKLIEGGLPAERLHVRPNFVTPDPGVGSASRQPYALFVGRLSPEKGVLTLLNAWRRLDGVPLKVAGDGPLLDTARRFVATHRVTGVELLGRRHPDEVRALMKGAAVLVFPSECYEGFPMTIAEAFACGLPVAAARRGTAAEIVADGHTGLHFTAEDPEDLAAKLRWAEAHPRQIAALGAAARREFEEKYTAERGYETLMDIYDAAISRAARDH